MDNVKLFLDGIIKENDTIIIATSTGPDSMALLFYMQKYIPKVNIICAHVNHKVRKQSDIEYLYLKDYCQKNNIIFEGMEIATKFSSNFEENSRQARYDFFKALKTKYNAKYIMTAHHGDDQIETILMRIVRGSNLNGYAGLKQIDTCFVKPFLFLEKKELIKYCHENNLKYYIDKTNKSNIHTRNRYRNNIVPLLKKENLKVTKKFMKFSNELQDYHNFVTQYINNINIINYNEVNIKKFLQQDSFIQRKIIEKMINNLQSKYIFNIQNKNIIDIIKLSKSTKSNLSINLENGFICKKEYDKLIIEKPTDLDPINIKFNDYYEDDSWIIKKIHNSNEKSNNIIRLYSKDIKLPLFIRNRVTGDTMKIKNLGHKKIKDIFIDEKLGMKIRNTYPLLVDSNNNILWIPGLKKSEFDKDKTEKYDIILHSERKNNND